MLCCAKLFEAKSQDTGLRKWFTFKLGLWIHLETGAIESHISSWFGHSFKNTQAGSPVVKKGSDIFIGNSIYSVECESKTQQGLWITIQETSAIKTNGWKHGGDDILWQEKGGKLQKNQIHCQRQRRATERSWLWSPTCWRVSIQPDERNSWQNMGSQAEAKVSSGGISRPLLQEKGKAGRREKAQNSQHLWTACKNICRQNLYELKTGSASSEINSKVFFLQ